MTKLYAKVHLCHKGSMILKGSHLPIDVEPEFLERWREEGAIAEVPVVDFALPPTAAPEEKSIPTATVELTLPLPEDVTAIVEPGPGIAEPVSSVVANEEAIAAGVLPAATVEPKPEPEPEPVPEKPAAGGADSSPAPTSPPPPVSNPDAEPDAAKDEQPKPAANGPTPTTGQRPPRGGRGK